MQMFAYSDYYEAYHDTEDKGTFSLYRQFLP